FELAVASRIIGAEGVAYAFAPGTDASKPLFNVGDLAAIIGTRPLSADSAQSIMRIVRITGVFYDSRIRRFEFHYDLCESGACSPQLSQLRNSTTLEIFAPGSSFIPVNFVYFHLSRDKDRSQVVSNEGGSLVP